MMNHNTTCVCAQCQAEQLRKKVARNHVNPLTRAERDEQREREQEAEHER